MFKSNNKYSFSFFGVVKLMTLIPLSAKIYVKLNPTIDKYENLLLDLCILMKKEQWRFLEV